MRTMRPPGWKIAAVLLVGILAISFGSILVRLALRASGDQSLAFSLVMSAGRLALAALLLAPGWTRPLEGRAGLPFALAAGGFSPSTSPSGSPPSPTPPWRRAPPSSPPTPCGSPFWAGGFSGSGLLSSPCSAWAWPSSGGPHRPGGQRGRRGANPLLGDFLALLGAVAASCYFLLGREAQRRGLSTWAYVRVAYTAAALLLLPLPYLFGGGYGGIPSEVYAYLLLMALLPQLVGHTSFNWATRHIPPVLVTLAILFEPVGASLLAYFLFGELPGSRVLLGALILLVGVALAVVGGRR